jgi:hypothetical protein
MDETTLPGPLQEALRCLRKDRMASARVDAAKDNFVYLWLPDIIFDSTKYSPPHRRGLWVRVPMAFPLVNPHGILTIGPLNPIVSHPIQGETQDTAMREPVLGLGATHYYSWTWTGELGEGPKLTAPSDILGVVSWIERRIRIA